MKTMILPVVFMMFCLLSSSHADSMQVDFCVADYTAPYGPSGYSCKNPLNVSASDFVYSGLALPGNTNNLIKASIKPAFDTQFGALNGLALSFTRIDLGVGGVIPIHTHPRATEALYVLQGKLTAGFISTNNTVYLKTLNQGDVIIFPHAYLHFILNQGKGPAVGIASFSSANPGIQFVSLSLFGNNIPTRLITNVSFINSLEVRRLKAVFGGSG